MKKAISLVLVLCTLFSLCCFASAAGFQDIGTEGTALYTAATALNERGIAKGVSETLYGTEKPVTREQMAAFIYRMLHDGKSLEGGENTTRFTDLADPTFFAMVSWVNKEGIIKGQSETAFNPKGGITLQDACTMLTRALGCEKNGELSYPDGYLTAAENNGLFQNVENTKETKRALTRGDVAILMYNTLQTYETSKKEADSNVPAAPAAPRSMDGKKIIFIGNSHTYYGRAVIAKNFTDLTQESRSNDQGLFYQICKSNGEKVAVTNWCYGSHTLTDFASGKCSAGKSCQGEDHLGYLTDKNYDYVVFQPNSSDTSATIVSSAKKLLEIFRAANPNVELIYLVHHRFYLNDQKDSISAAKQVEKLGISVVDWGNMVYDIYSGNVKVEGAKYEHTKNTYVVSKSKTDGFHPSMLTGYITAQMVYCHITGKSAVGQDYSFCGNASVNKKFDFDQFVAAYYTYGDATTNFPKVFQSPSDMEGIQKLIDKYLAEKPYRNR